MFQSIDDILNANDSDEDIDTKSVDLEQLLDDNDSDDENNTTTNDNNSNNNNNNNKNNNNKSNNNKNKKSLNIVDNILLEEEEEEEEVNSEQNNIGELLLALSGNEKYSIENNDIDLTFQTSGTIPSSISFNNSENIEKEGELNQGITLLSTLELADRREQRMMKSGDRDGVSALQAKLSSLKNDGDSQSLLFQLKCITLETISSQLSRNVQFRQHGPGTATVVQISSKFIAVGTTRGLVLLFDHAEEMRQVIGSSIPSNTRNSSPVTAIDVTLSSDTLFCGHENGELIIWETAKGTILKRISDLHSKSIVKFSIVYGVGEITSNINGISNDYSLVSVDKKGVVMKSKLSKVLFLAVSVESECLLDGTAGVVLDLSPLSPHTLTTSASTSASTSTLPSFSSSSSSSSSLSPSNHESVPCSLRASEQLIALNSETRTYIIRVYPEVTVLNRWPAPREIVDETTGVIRPGSVVSLDWSWGYSNDFPVLKSRNLTSGKGTSSYIFPLLVRGWGRSIQLYACCIPNNNNNITTTNNNTSLTSTTSITTTTTTTMSSINSEAPSDYLILGEVNFDEDTKILAIRWLGPNTILSLTSREVYVIRVPEFTTDRIPLNSSLTTLLTLSMAKKGLDDLLDVSVAVAKQRMYVLSTEKMFVFYIQSWREQIDQLISDGQWLDALTLVLDRYKTSGKSKKRIDQVNIPSSTSSSTTMTNTTTTTTTNYFNSDEVTSADLEVYIRRYADMAVVRQQNTSLFGKKVGYQSGQHHYFLVAAVCIEYCILSGGQLINVLFEEIYQTFSAAHQQAIFIESLEPFILRRQIRDLPPNIYSDFLDYSLRLRKFAFLERCISHFDLVDIDINATVHILQKNELISGFLYAYSYGLLDYAGAFQLIFEHMMIKQTGEFPSPEQTDIGYKLFLFIQYTSQSRVFPRGEKLALNSSALSSLIKAMLSPAILPPIAGSLRLEKSLETHPLFLKTFPYLFALAKIDFYALFHCLHLSLVELYSQGIGKSLNIKGQDSTELSYGDMLYSVLLFAKFGDEEMGMKNSFQRCYYEHSLDHIVSVTCILPEPFIQEIILHCRYHIKPLSLAEKYIFSLVSSQSKNISFLSNFTSSLEKSGFYFPALRLYGSKLKPTSETLSQAIESYLSNKNEDQRLKLFEYINEFFNKLTISGDNNNNNNSNNNNTSSLISSDNLYDIRINQCRLVLVANIEELATLNLIQTKKVVTTYLSNNISQIIEKTQKHQRLQFELFDAFVRGVSESQSDNVMDESLGQYSTENSNNIDELLNSQQMLIYITQLATFRPSDLLQFLTVHHNYPLDDVLKLCRTKGIFDATAFLLERAGDFQSALNLCVSEISLSLQQIMIGIKVLLKDYDTKVVTMSRRGSKDLSQVSVEVQSILKIVGTQPVSTGGYTYGLSSSILEPVHKLEGFISFSKSITTVIGICTRHDVKSSAVYWFRVLDHLLKEKHNLVSSTNTSQNQDILKSSEEIAREVAAIIVGYALKDFMGHMSSHVPSQDIVRRITKENILGSRFAEFKDVMISMVESYAYEVSLYETYLKINTDEILKLRAQRMKSKHKGLRHNGDIHSISNLNEGSDSTISSTVPPLQSPPTSGIYLISNEQDDINDSNRSSSSSLSKTKSKYLNKYPSRAKIFRDIRKHGSSFDSIVNTSLPPTIPEYNVGQIKRSPGLLPIQPHFQAAYGD